MMNVIRSPLDRRQRMRTGRRCAASNQRAARHPRARRHANTGFWPSTQIKFTAQMRDLPHKYENYYMNLLHKYMM